MREPVYAFGSMSPASCLRLARAPTPSFLRAYRRGWPGRRPAMTALPSNDLDQGPRQTLEQAAPIGAADQGVDEVLGVRHQAEHAQILRINAGDGMGRAVRIGRFAQPASRVALAEGDELLALQPRHRRIIGDIIAFTMSDADLDGLMLRIGIGEGRIGALDPQMLEAADEMHPRIAHQNARQEPRLAGDLEAVTDGEHEATALRMGADGLHDRASRRDRAATQIIAIAEPAGEHDEIGAGGKLAL